MFSKLCVELSWAGGKCRREMLAPATPGASRATSAAQVGACVRLVIKSFFRALFQHIFKPDLQDTHLISSSPVLNVYSVKGLGVKGLIVGSRCHWKKITELVMGGKTAGPIHSGVGQIIYIICKLGSVTHLSGDLTLLNRTIKNIISPLCPQKRCRGLEYTKNFLWGKQGDKPEELQLLHEK